MVMSKSKVIFGLALLQDTCQGFEAFPTSSSSRVRRRRADISSSHATKLKLNKEERRQDARDHNARSTCPNCNRPTTTCLCPALPPTKISLTHTHILILQHPVEFRRKNISTVPVLGLVLEHVKVCVGRTFDDNFMENILEESEAQKRTPLLLFPGPDATTLEDSTALEELQSKSKELFQNQDLSQYLLIIIDGTWTQARSIVRHSSPLLLTKCLPIQFLSTEKSGRSVYHSIRQQPDAHCLSTLEACGRTLPLLQKLRDEALKKQHAAGRKGGPDQVEDAVRHLNAALRLLVDTQLENEKKRLMKSEYIIRNPDKLKNKLMRQK